MKETMSLLADNWEIGFGICSVLCIVIYLVFSITLIRSSRNKNYDIGVSAMIPIWNIVVLFKKMMYVRKISKPIGEDEEIVL